MKLLSILNCVRPVYFLNAEHEWPLSVSGSAFLVIYQGRHFVITAAHVLRCREFQPTQFRVQYHPEDNHFIPIASCYRMHESDPEDTDQYDLAVWDVHEETLELERFGDYRPYNLLQLDALTLFNPKADYLYRGFPCLERDYDPEGRHMRQTAVSGRARYLRRTAAAGVHEIELLAVAELESLDGFSGAPVFQVNPVEDPYSTESFAGVLIRGSRQSERAYFLEHRSILSVLTQIRTGRIAPLSPPSGP